MSRKFTLAINCDNAAFEDVGAPFEIARILSEVAEKLDTGSYRGSIRDANGNVVGSYALEDSK